jgi:hypothetical protein
MPPEKSAVESRRPGFIKLQIILDIDDAATICTRKSSDRCAPTGNGARGAVSGTSSRPIMTAFAEQIPLRCHGYSIHTHNGSKQPFTFTVTTQSLGHPIFNFREPRGGR